MLQPLPPIRRQKKNSGIPVITPRPLPSLSPLKPETPAGRPGTPAALAMTPAGSSEASLDDADALPAVGKVWDSGPKRSLSSIFAAAKPKPASEAENSATPYAMTAELQATWQAILQAAAAKFGNAVSIPLTSAEPRREGSTFIVRFVGPFAQLGALVQKYRDQIHGLICEVTGESLALSIEVDASAPPPKIAPQAPRSGNGTPATGPAAPPAPAPARDGIPLTAELRTELENNPFIRAILEGFNANVVKVE